MRVAQQRQQLCHLVEVERCNVIAQMLFLFVVGLLKKVINRLFVGSKGLFTFDLNYLFGRAFLVFFFLVVFIDFAIKT